MNKNSEKLRVSILDEEFLRQQRAIKEFDPENKQHKRAYYRAVIRHVIATR
jgi:hypothetical protein